MASSKVEEKFSQTDMSKQIIAVFVRTLVNALILTVNDPFPDTTKSTIDAWIKTFQLGIECMEAHH